MNTDKMQCGLVNTKSGGEHNFLFEAGLAGFKRDHLGLTIRSVASRKEG